MCVSDCVWRCMSKSLPVTGGELPCMWPKRNSVESPQHRKGARKEWKSIRKMSDGDKQGMSKGRKECKSDGRNKWINIM